MFEDRKLLLVGSIAASGAALAFWRSKRKNQHRSNVPTDFEAYLKNPIKNPSISNHISKAKKIYAPTSFEAFLSDPEIFNRNDASSCINATEALTQNIFSQPKSAPRDSKPVTILFGTEFGFSREIAEKLFNQLSETGIYWPQLLNMADFPHGLPLDTAQALLVICSTQGDGVPPTEARDFCSWLLGGTTVSLSTTFFSVCALGDSSYTHFCQCGKTIFARLQALGGLLMAPRMDVDKEDWKAVNRWIDSVIQGLENSDLKTVKELGGFEGIDTTLSSAPAGAATSSLGGGASVRYTKSKPYYGSVVAVENLCCETDARSDKKTVRIELDLGDSQLQYTPGDALGIWPTNNSSSVKDLLHLLHIDPMLAVRIPSWHYRDDLIQEGATTMPIQDALERCYDLRTPKHDLLNMIEMKLKESLEKEYSDAENHSKESQHGDDDSLQIHQCVDNKGKVLNTSREDIADAADKIAHLLNDDNDNDDDYVDKNDCNKNGSSSSTALAAYMSQRHVIDILREFSPAVTLTAGELLSTLRQLAPRLYSISSSPLEDPRRVQITVAVVEYSSLGIERKGVASTYLADHLSAAGTFAAGTCIDSSPAKVPLYMYPNNEFRLPENIATPIIMVGPGTGVAPFRAFLKHRELLLSLLQEKEENRLDESGADADLCLSIGKNGVVVVDSDQQQQCYSKLMHGIYDRNTSLYPRNGNNTSNTNNRNTTTTTSTNNGIDHDGIVGLDATSILTEMYTETSSLSSSQTHQGQAVLYFGCRRRDQDYLYGDLLEKYSENGSLILYTAFSREEQGKKVYVQDRLKESRNLVWELLENNGAHFYICGDGDHMAVAVEKELFELVKESQNEGEAAALEYIDHLRLSGRYQKDVWSSYLVN